MNSYRTSKVNSERPRLSARAYDNENDDNDSLDRSTRSSKLPKRTYSLEGKEITCCEKKTNTKPKASTTSMIPRLERNKFLSSTDKGISKRVSTPNGSASKDKKVSEPQLLNATNSEKEEHSDSKLFPSVPEVLQPQNSTSPKISDLETKINNDFISFKNNVLRIPEYWTDAGQTVTHILKNAVNIVTKQYPTADVESFETEIQNILRATEIVKQQILAKTENIINKANNIYLEKNDFALEPGMEDLQKITKKMEDLKNEVNVRKNVFGDLLKFGSEMKQLIELEKALKQKGPFKENPKKDISGKADQNYEVEQRKRLKGKKVKSGVDNCIVENKKRENNVLQSCGDVLRQEKKPISVTCGIDGKAELDKISMEEKQTQTCNLWTAEILRKEEDLKELNRQILELQKLCQDHISKFKSFNLQIKLRGLCNKAQHTSISKEIQILNDEKTQLAEKNNKLRNYNQDLESAIKQRDLDIHQKDRLISQQKKLLNVRDELIEMLKNRCNFEETKHLG